MFPQWFLLTREYVARREALLIAQEDGAMRAARDSAPTDEGRAFMDELIAEGERNWRGTAGGDAWTQAAGFRTCEGPRPGVHGEEPYDQAGYRAQRVVLGLALVAPARSACSSSRCANRRPPPEISAGRYQALQLEGRLLLVDTTTGEAWMREAVDGDGEWWRKRWTSRNRSGGGGDEPTRDDSPTLAPMS